MATSVFNVHTLVPTATPAVQWAGSPGTHSAGGTCLSHLSAAHTPLPLLSPHLPLQSAELQVGAAALAVALCCPWGGFQKSMPEVSFHVRKATVWWETSPTTRKPTLTPTHRVVAPHPVSTSHPFCVGQPGPRSPSLGGATLPLKPPGSSLYHLLLVLTPAAQG